MSATLFRTATEYAANQLTFLRGSVADIIDVGVYHTEDPSYIPSPTDFTMVQLVNGQLGHPLAEGTRIDVLSLIGPRNGDVTLTAGIYQRWVLVRTVTEDIIRRPDTLTIV